MTINTISIGRQWWSRPEYSAAERLADALWHRSRASDLDENGYVSFGDVARVRLGGQCQYVSRHVNKDFAHDPAYPFLGQDLRLTGNPSMYHCLRIH